MIRPWEPNIVAKSRAAWVRVLGAPANIWGEEFFKQVTQLFGTFISIDTSTKEKTRLDFGRALFMTLVPES